MNTFMFAFQDKKGAEKVLREGPWSIDGHSLTLMKWDGDKRMDDVDLSKITF